MFATRSIARFLLNSLIVSVGATMVAVTLGALAAYGFSRFAIRGAAAFLIALLFTKMLPETLLIVPFFRLFSALGLIDTHCALILAYSTVSLPFALWMLIGFLDAHPARDRRGGDRRRRVAAGRRLRGVILPLARPGLVAVGFFTFVAAWNSYLWALVLTTSAGDVRDLGRGGQHGRRISRAMERADGRLGHRDVARARSCSPLFSRHLVEAITAGAVKG